MSYGRFVLNLAFFIPAFRLGTRCARISIAVLCLAAVLIIGARNTEAQQTAVCSETPGTGERVQCTEDADSSKEIKLTLKGIDIDTTDDDTHSVAGHHEGSGRIFIDFQTGLDESGTGTLTDNDGTPTLTIADARATEGNPVEFTVTLDPASASDVTVEYATTDGTATANSTDPDGADYTAPTNGATLTISTGQTTGTISIATGNDNVDEDDETFTLTLSNPSSNAALGTEKTAIGTIEDDDTDPFWQQAYTNLVKWIIELYRIFPDRWVTLRDVYRCAIDPELFKQKLDEAKGVVKTQMQGAIVISAKDLDKRRAALGGVPWATFSDGERQTLWTAELAKWLQREGVAHRVAPVSAHTDTDRLRARYESVKTWYEKDWMQMDPKLRTSCVEGISSFLSLFDMEDVSDIFCPKAPAKERAAEGEEDGNGDSRPPVGKARMRRLLPPLDELIESGKILALNMPAGSNPALARAIGVFLKNAWLQTLLRRPAQMKADTKRYFRPAVFICDEYQSFASVGEEDPSGDEKAFALTRQCRVIPIVATQSISSLRSVLGTSEAWRALLQTLRTRIFLSLSDDASAEIASKLCGQVAKIKPSWTVTESAQQAQVSLLSGRAGGSRGSVGTSKSFREQREALFQPREFGVLPNCQAICLPYDGTNAASAVRVYLKPYYLPVDTPYWRAVEKGKI